ncbi:glycoside hydrolase family 13 protein [Actinomadura rudentiformis]|uniref:Glycoside hydrolase family 13 protein n=1 Tax=Actinomadura rudentiformis TaxID=359158 RepID=A0A6H9YYZ1_9ACTN|nr:glycoside hydrolase family 13 protein [Actinomadura rudentiformis]KAB2349564.1 glycoside hydrolase family 13 protein [Actinomadura rudentiformis]
MTQHSTTVSTTAAVPATGTRWWRDAVIYQVYVRSFADSDGDGIGDLAGIRSRLPYLAELGVDALWLTPFYTSPMADFGYDVADYRDVDPIFGSLNDARALVRDVHEHGMRIIVDVVPNHSSDMHAWFQEALEAAPGGPERARYVFRDGRGPDGAEPPNDWESVFGGPAWTRVPDGQWYLHLFAPEQPDLNWENPEVHREFDDVLRFWLDLGVDGFRIDVAHGMVKAPGLPDLGYTDQISMLGREVLPYFDQDGVHDIHRGWRRLLDSYEGERIGVAEAWAPTQERLADYVRPDELHQAFNFHYLTADWSARDKRAVIEESLRTVDRVGAPSTWVLSNHDVKRHVTRYGDGEVGVRRARAAALLMLALPGSAYVYQGEELGLAEVLDLPEEYLQDPQRGRDPESGRDGCRVPLPWSGDAPPFGFGPGSSWLPMPEGWRDLTVERQEADPESMLALYRAALRIRREHPALGDGTLRWLPAPDGALVFERGTAADGTGASEGTGGRRLVCAVNLGQDTVRVPAYGRPLLASAPVRPDGDRLVLPPDTAVWCEAMSGQ